MLKILKRLKRWRNKSGFTLVEVIVASALLGILLIGVFSFTAPVMKSVAAKEQNARAVMLSETIDSYIMNMTKYSYFVQTFTGVVDSDVKKPDDSNDPPILSVKYPATGEWGNNGLDKVKSHADESLKNMKDTLAAMGSNYEVRCMGIRFIEDPKTGVGKLMLTNEYIDQTTFGLDLSRTQLVFESCFYDGLYPIIKLENYDNQYQMPDDDGNLKDQIEADKVEIAKALKITTEVYLDDSIYNVNENVRKSAMLNFSGTSYVDFAYIRSNVINQAKQYKVQPNIEVRGYGAAQANAPTKVTENDAGQSCYYPDTYIYFITRKQKSNYTTNP